MAMTLRTTPEVDSALERIAARWGVSKTEAIVRAIREADASRSLEDDAMEAYSRVTAQYRDAIDRLGTV